MCGICGFTQADRNQRAHVESHVRHHGHRGPDGEGQYIDAESGVALGHRRLSLIDLANGNQPMVRSTGAHDSIVTSPATEGTPAARSSSPSAITPSCSTVRSTTTATCATSWPRTGWTFQPSPTPRPAHGSYWPGASCARPPARHVRVRHLGCEQAGAVLRPRFLRHQTVLLHRRKNGRFIFASEIKCILEHPPTSASSTRRRWSSTCASSSAPFPRRSSRASSNWLPRTA